jgi:hypothetical protein
MARHTEPLNGGVWSSLDPALLKPGQLSAGRNFVYLAGSPAIYRSWGRSEFGAVSASAVDVNGLRDAQFDGGDHILIAAASASYLTAAVGDTGTFGLLASGLPGVPTQLEAVQYRNRFYLLNGVSTPTLGQLGTNGCLYVSAAGTGIPATFRQHGMIPVSAAPIVTTAAGTFSQTVTGYYEYWTTEVAKIQTDGATLSMESTFSPPTTTVAVLTTATVPKIFMPGIANSAITTHWRIYRSTKKDAAKDVRFPIGYMISEVPATGTGIVTSVSDTSVSVTASSFPASANGVGDGATWMSAWTNASAAFVDDGNFTSGTSGPVLYPEQLLGQNYQGYYGFNFGGISGPVCGVEVEVQAYLSGGTSPAPLDIWIAPNRQSNGLPDNVMYPYVNHGQNIGYARWAKKSTLVTATTSAAPQTVTVGGSTDTWFAGDNTAPLNGGDFGPNFMVVIRFPNPGGYLCVDYLKAKAYYNATIDSTVQFPTVVYTYGDEVIQVGKNGTPPSSSTGDLFQDSLVVNDLSDPSMIRYSYPGSPESFPATYYLNFETRENDAVKMIRVVNNRLIVGLGSSLWRVNYLPSERDATFDRGKAMECISRSYGVVNPMCACTFMPDGATELLAFVSNQGVHYTDGYNFTTLTDGVDWRTDCLSTTSGVTATPIALINDKENCILRFYYRNDALGNESYMCLPLCYGAGHWTNGQAKVGGMLHMRNMVASGATAVYSPLKSAWQLDRSNGAVDFLFGYGVQTNSSATGVGYATGAGAGKVYRETGTTIPALDSSMQYTTRRMYLSGLSKEWRLNEVYGYAGSYSGGPVVTYTAKNTKTNGTGETTVGSKSITLTGQQLHKVNFQQICEGLRLTESVVASSYRQESIVLDGENFGIEDSGR